MKPAEVFRESNPMVISAPDIYKAAQRVMGGNPPEVLLSKTDRDKVDWMVIFTSPHSVRLVSCYPTEEVRKAGVADTSAGRRPVAHAEWLIRHARRVA